MEGDESMDERRQMDVFSFNGEDIRVTDLLGPGAFFNGGMKFDVDCLLNGAQELNIDEMSDEYEDWIKENMEVLAQTQKTWKDVLLEKPLPQSPSYDDMIKDPAFVSVVGDYQVYKKILKFGTGKTVAPDSKVWFHFVGFIQGVPKSYDSTLKQEKPVSVRLEPAGEIIVGLRLALKTMQVLETAQIFIPWEYGYGELGCPDRIPPRANLILNVKMITHVPVERLTYWQLSPEERANLTFPDLVRMVSEERTRGNQKALAGTHWKAVRHFRKGIDLFEEISTKTNEENLQRCKILAFLYGNLAESYCEQEGKAPQACASAKKGLALEIQESKSYLLRIFAAAKLKLKHYDAAWNLLKRAEQELDPEGNGPEKTKQVELEFEIKSQVTKDKSELVSQELRSKVFEVNPFSMLSPTKTTPPPKKTPPPPVKTPPPPPPRRAEPTPPSKYESKYDWTNSSDD